MTNLFKFDRIIISVSFRFLLLLFLSFLVLSANAAELFCDFKSTAPVIGYICVGNITTTETDYLVDRVSGNHVEGKRNSDITTVVFMHLPMEVLPKNLKAWFGNYSELAMVDIPNLPSLNRSFFYDFTYLTSLYARNLSNTKILPKDTFWDLPKLKYLFLDGIVNLENLHSDLLINARSLKLFSSRGPNKITQINPGFFRHQGETLEEVDFKGSHLISIAHSTFVNLQSLQIARFHNCGCLHNIYKNSLKITSDVRAQCEDVTI